MDAGQVQQVRRFNRLITQRVGALEDDYLRRGRPLGEARLLYEVGADGAEVLALRRRLGLDSGYVSRLLRSLEAQGLVAVGRSAGDGRQRRVALTERGLAELAAYDRQSDALAESFLGPLDFGERGRLTEAMAEVERLIRAAGVEVRAAAPQSAEARWCLSEYFRELGDRFETGFDPARSNPASEAEMTPPAGWFVIAWLDGEAVGCGALKVQGGGIGEIKRMWTSSAARRLGVAHRVLAALEDLARGAGLKTLRLETNRTLTEAQALYRRSGYQEVARFNDEPYAHHWFEKTLSAGTERPGIA